MTDNEFLLFDRLQKIRSVIEQYGEENFFLSFSGGKDSTVLSWLLDEAIPGNTIPRVFSNTGIEYNMIVDFVRKKADEPHAWPLVILEPSRNIRETLQEYGYPFKSKYHAKTLDHFQRLGMTPGVEKYAKGGTYVREKSCPYMLRYQFQEDFPLRVSDKCCELIKEKPLSLWAKENNRRYGIIGIMRDEGGRRENAVCMRFIKGKFTNFQPLAPITKEWEAWLIEEKKIDICDIYKPPYNFHRTGCKGCPFSIHLQEQLDTMQQFFPTERKQCEILWAPVYTEYRRLGYRLRKPAEEKPTDPAEDGLGGRPGKKAGSSEVPDFVQLSIFDYLEEDKTE